jgi:hypothetical protein
MHCLAGRTRSDFAKTREYWGAVRVPAGVCFETGLEIDNKRRGKNQRAYDAEPKPALDKVRIDTKQHTGYHRRELRLPFSVDYVGNAKCTGNDAKEEIVHCAIRCIIVKTAGRRSKRIAKSGLLSDGSGTLPPQLNVWLPFGCRTHAKRHNLKPVVFIECSRNHVPLKSIQS